MIQNDFARLESETTDAESEVLRILTSSLESRGRCLGQYGDRHLRILIVVRTQSESSVNTLSVIQDIDQRICPTVVQAGVIVSAGGLRRYTSQVVGKNQQFFACAVNEYAGNRTDRKFDTRLKILTVIWMSDDEEG